MARQALLGLGANLGDPPAMFRWAADELDAAGMEGMRLSALYRSAGINAEGNFFNAALTGHWAGSARDLLDLCLDIERRTGRLRTTTNAPRLLDIDLLLFAQEECDDEHLRLPHPRMHLRRFALEPACDLVPALVHPHTRRSLIDMLFDRKIQAQEVRRVDWPKAECGARDRGHL